MGKLEGRGILLGGRWINSGSLGGLNSEVKLLKKHDGCSPCPQYAKRECRCLDTIASYSFGQCAMAVEGYQLNLHDVYQGQKYRTTRCHEVKRAEVLFPSPYVWLAVILLHVMSGWHAIRLHPLAHCDLFTLSLTPSSVLERGCEI